MMSFSEQWSTRYIHMVHFLLTHPKHMKVQAVYKSEFNIKLILKSSVSEIHVSASDPLTARILYNSNIYIPYLYSIVIYFYATETAHLD